eukprot:4787838-Amphidinium_carterae.1
MSCYRLHGLHTKSKKMNTPKRFMLFGPKKVFLLQWDYAKNHVFYLNFLALKTTEDYRSTKRGRD